MWLGWDCKQAIGSSDGRWEDRFLSFFPFMQTWRLSTSKRFLRRWLCGSVWIRVIVPDNRRFREMYNGGIPERSSIAPIGVVRKPPVIHLTAKFWMQFIIVRFFFVPIPWKLYHKGMPYDKTCYNRSSFLRLPFDIPYMPVFFFHDVFNLLWSSLINTCSRFHMLTISHVNDFTCLWLSHVNRIHMLYLYLFCMTTLYYKNLLVTSLTVV